MGFLFPRPLLYSAENRLREKKEAIDGITRTNPEVCCCLSSLSRSLRNSAFAQGKESPTFFYQKDTNMGEATQKGGAVLKEAA